MRHDQLLHRKFVIVFTIVLWVFSGVLSPRSVGKASQAAARKIREWQRESGEIMRFSMRVYRLYKSCSRPPVAQASKCQ